MADRGHARFAEPPAVVADVAQRAGVSGRYAESVLRDLHHVIDRLVGDDCSILLGPLYLTMHGDPVLERILERFTADDWANPFGWKTAEYEDLARFLDLPAEEVAIRPPAFGTTVLLELADWRAVDGDDETELRRLDAVIWAWRHHMDTAGITYRISTAGLEADFDNWLEKNLDALSEDYPVEVITRQHSFKNRKRLDFLCGYTKETEHARTGDLLVIENKAHLADKRALTQLLEYTGLVKAEVAADGEAVKGLLICDGTTVELSRDIRDTKCGYTTLSAIGYRDHLYRQNGLDRASEPGVPDISEGVTRLDGPPAGPPDPPGDQS